jgi:hypothetical protein
VIHRLSASSSPIITPNSNNPSPVPSFFFILRPFFVGTTGDSYDNALAESIIGLFKTEVVGPRGPWKNLDSAARFIYGSLTASEGDEEGRSASLFLRMLQPLLTLKLLLKGFHVTAHSQGLFGIAF